MYKAYCRNHPYSVVEYQKIKTEGKNKKLKEPPDIGDSARAKKPDSNASERKRKKDADDNNSKKKRSDLNGIADKAKRRTHESSEEESDDKEEDKLEKKAYRPRH